MFRIACEAFLASTPFLLGKKVLFLARTGLSKSECKFVLSSLLNRTIQFLMHFINLWFMYNTGTSIRRRHVLTRSSKSVRNSEDSKDFEIVGPLRPWILKRMNGNPTAFAFIKHDLDNFWGYRAHMFNSLLWENLFGIKICEIQPRHSDSSEGDRYPKLKAIMTFDSKIESLASFLAGECGKEHLLGRPKFSKLTHDKCNEFLESLKSGKLVPAPYYSCDILEGWSPYALLTFDIEVALIRARDNAKNLPCWVLSVKNITCRKLRYVLLLKVIRKMVRRLWLTYISWMLDFEFCSSN